MRDKLFDVKQTRNHREAKKLQEQGWELTGINRSITWGNQFNLRRPRPQVAPKVPSAQLEARSRLLRAEAKLKRVDRKLDRKPSAKLVERRALLAAEVERLRERV